jgi:hypothetical protein
MKVPIAQVTDYWAHIEDYSVVGACSICQFDFIYDFQNLASPFGNPIIQSVPKMS